VSVKEMPKLLGLINRNVNAEGELIHFLESIRWIRITDYGCYKYKTSHVDNEKFHTVDIRKRNQLLTDTESMQLPVRPRIHNRIKAAKIKDIFKQLDYIPAAYRQYDEGVIQKNSDAAQNDNGSDLDCSLSVSGWCSFVSVYWFKTRYRVCSWAGIQKVGKSKSRSEDFVALKRILRYLKGTADHGLTYQPGYELDIVSYSDADHGGDLQTSRSTTGVVCLHAGAAVSWLSQKQPSVAISTTESEIVAASEAAREIVWLRRLMETMLHQFCMSIMKQL